MKQKENDPAHDCDDFVKSDDTTDQIGVLKTWNTQKVDIADRMITIRAYFIEARGIKPPHKQAGYMRAILSMTPPIRNLAKWEETMYGFHFALPILPFFAASSGKLNPKRPHDISLNVGVGREKSSIFL